MLVSPKQDDARVEYPKLLAAMSSTEDKVAAFKRKKRLPVADFAPFFDDSVGNLDSDADGSDVPKFRLQKLPPNVVHHAFISHKQSTAADMAANLALKLKNRGLDVWHDQSIEGNLAEPEMKKGIMESKCYVLLLSKGVFQSAAVKMELETAIGMGKTVLLVHEAQTNMPGYADFNEYVNTCPPFAEHLFKQRESMAFRRRKYEADPFLEELLKRIDAGS